MAAGTGREQVLRWGSTKLCGTEKTISFNGENIDISDECSSGWQKLLNASGQDSVEMTLTGIDKDDVLVAAWFSGNRIEDMDWTRITGSVIAGEFRLSALSTNAPFNGASTFEATFSSSGEITFTPA